MNRSNLKAPPAIQIIKDEARKLPRGSGQNSPDSPKPFVIGKAHKFLWQQDINLDIEVFKLAPKFGEYYCVFAVNVDTAEQLPKVYVSGEILNEILAIKQNEIEEEEGKTLSFNRQKEIINILTNGLSVTSDIKHLILPKGIQGTETMQETNSHLGSPKVRSKKRTTMADFNKGFDELAKQNQEMSLHINDANKQMKLMRLAVLAFDNKKGFNYHDDSPKGRWHRAYRKIMYRLIKSKIIKILNRIGTYGQFDIVQDAILSSETKTNFATENKHK
jgi:hypothetical protein